eukprot:Hpha_TRINITY_DN10798_c0_g1::TRINITY_DN10798_c0_g1_i1::g.43807::m.43807
MVSGKSRRTSQDVAGGTVMGLMHAVDVKRHDTRTDFTTFALRMGLKSVRLKFSLPELDGICDKVRKFLLLRGRPSVAFQLRMSYYLRCVRRMQELTRGFIRNRDQNLSNLFKRWAIAEKKKKEQLHETLRHRVRAAAGSRDGDPHRGPNQPAVTDESVLHALRMAITPRDIKMQVISELYAWARIAWNREYIAYEQRQADSEKRNKIGFKKLHRSSTMLQDAVRFATLKRQTLSEQTQAEQDQIALENSVRQAGGGVAFESLGGSAALDETSNPFGGIQQPPDFRFRVSVPELREHARRVSERWAKQRLEDRKDEIIREIDRRTAEEDASPSAARRRSSVHHRRSSVGGDMAEAAAAAAAAVAASHEDEPPKNWYIARLFRSGFPYGESAPGSNPSPPGPRRPSLGGSASGELFGRKSSVTGTSRRGSVGASASEMPRRTSIGERRGSNFGGLEKRFLTGETRGSQIRPRSAPGQRPDLGQRQDSQVSWRSPNARSRRSVTISVGGDNESGPTEPLSTTVKTVESSAFGETVSMLGTPAESVTISPRGQASPGRIRIGDKGKGGQLAAAAGTPPEEEPFSQLGLSKLDPRLRPANQRSATSPSEARGGRLQPIVRPNQPSGPMPSVPSPRGRGRGAGQEKPPRSPLSDSRSQRRESVQKSPLAQSGSGRSRSSRAPGGVFGKR